MEKLANKLLPKGMTYEWSGLSLEEIESSGKAAILFGLGLVFVYLTLAAQYESFVLPSIVLLGVPVALLERSARLRCGDCQTMSTARSGW